MDLTHHAQAVQAVTEYRHAQVRHRRAAVRNVVTPANTGQARLACGQKVVDVDVELAMRASAEATAADAVFTALAFTSNVSALTDAVAELVLARAAVDARLAELADTTS